jgi:hypothetical protein
VVEPAAEIMRDRATARCPVGRFACGHGWSMKGVAMRIVVINHVTLDGLT